MWRVMGAIEDGRGIAAAPARPPLGNADQRRLELKTPAAEVTQALLIVMRRGSFTSGRRNQPWGTNTDDQRLAQRATGKLNAAAIITQVLASDLHFDEFWSFVPLAR